MVGGVEEGVVMMGLGISSWFLGSWLFFISLFFFSGRFDLGIHI